MNPRKFIEIDHCQARKHGHKVSGDQLFVRRIVEENRLLAVLADGLGSGIKANVLSGLTGRMALRCITGRMDIRRTAERILDILPVCGSRGIAYCAFTIVDVDGAAGSARIIEFDNPRAVFVRGGRFLELAAEPVKLRRQVVKDRECVVYHTELQVQEGDRLILFSDGVTQAGMEDAGAPLGWGRQAAAEYILSVIQQAPGVSARTLAARLVDQALNYDHAQPRDDITAAVVYLRQPRHLLLATGPPIDASNDAEMAWRIEKFDGRKIICGGTTAAIFGRETRRRINMDIDDLNDYLPPASKIEGIDLVTEGSLTLERVAELLENHSSEQWQQCEDAAVRIIRLMLNSDIIHFLIGTKVNDAHQEPTTPVEVDLRRNVVRRISRCLENRYSKETRFRMI